MSDENPKPRKLVSAWSEFLKHYRQKFREEQPDAPFAEFSRQAADTWKNLKPEEKAMFEEKAREVKEQAKAKDVKSHSRTESVPANQIESPYHIFLVAQHARLRSEEPELSYIERVNKIVDMWNSMTTVEKATAVMNLQKAEEQNPEEATQPPEEAPIPEAGDNTYTEDIPESEDNQDLIQDDTTESPTETQTEQPTDDAV